MVDTPTIDEFVERFPEFEDQADKAELMIPEAARYVPERLLEADQKMAVMYVLAHLLTGETLAAEGDHGGGLSSESFSIAGISESKSYAAANSNSGKFWMSTEYGRRYYDLFKRSFTGTGILAV